MAPMAPMAPRPLHPESPNFFKFFDLHDSVCFQQVVTVVRYGYMCDCIYTFRTLLSKTVKPSAMQT